MAKPTVYKWTDPGAPQVKYNSVSDYQALFQAVLIDGYGSKLPPVDGLNKWSIPFSDAGGFILKQGGTQSRKCCIKLFDMYSRRSYRGTQMRVQKADDFSDYNTPINEWETPHNYHNVFMGESHNPSYNVPWVIFATERTIIFMGGSNNEQTDSLVFDTYLRYGSCIDGWLFGDYEPYDQTMVNNQICLHRYNRNSDSDDPRGTLASSYKYYHHRCRNDYNDDLGVNEINYLTTCVTMGNSVYISGSKDSKLPDYPNKLDGGLYLEKSRVLTNAILGNIPGVLFPIHSLPFPRNGIIHIIPGSGTYSGSNIYVFSARYTDSSNDYYQGQFMIHDGEWGVD